MPPQEYQVSFFGTPRIAELNGVTVETGQIMGSTILATKIINDTKDEIYLVDRAKTIGGAGWKWPALEEAIWGRAVNVTVTPRVTMFTLEAEVHGIINIISNCPPGALHVLDLYWDPLTDEIVIKTEEPE